VPQPRSVEATLCKRPRLHEQQEGKQLSHGRNLSSLIGTISVEIIAFYFRLSLTGVAVEKVGDGNAFLGWDDCGSRVFSFYLS